MPRPPSPPEVPSAGVRRSSTGSVRAEADMCFPMAMRISDRISSSVTAVDSALSASSVASFDKLQLIDDTDNRGVHGRKFLAQCFAGGPAFNHDKNPLAHA